MKWEPMTYVRSAFHIPGPKLPQVCSDLIVRAWTIDVAAIVRSKVTPKIKEDLISQWQYSYFFFSSSFSRRYIYMKNCQLFGDRFVFVINKQWLFARIRTLPVATFLRWIYFDFTAASWNSHVPLNLKKRHFIVSSRLYSLKNIIIIL